MTEEVDRNTGHKRQFLDSTTHGPYTGTTRHSGNADVCNMDIFGTEFGLHLVEGCLKPDVVDLVNNQIDVARWSQKRQSRIVCQQVYGDGLHKVQFFD